MMKSIGFKLESTTHDRFKRKAQADILAEMENDLRRKLIAASWANLAINLKIGLNRSLYDITNQSH